MADLGRNDSVIQQREPNSGDLHPLRSPTLGSVPTAHRAVGRPPAMEHSSVIGNAVETVSLKDRNPALAVLRMTVLSLGISSPPQPVSPQKRPQKGLDYPCPEDNLAKIRLDPKANLPLSRSLKTKFLSIQ